MDIKLWVNNFSEDYGEGAHAGFQWDFDLPISEVVIGCATDTRWTGNIYDSQNMMSIRGPRELRRYKESLARWGIGVSAAIGAKGLDPQAEGINAAAALAVTGAGVINFEAGFWQAPIDNIRLYMETIRAIVPNAVIGVTASSSSPEQIAAFRPYVDEFWDAAYFGDPPDALTDPDPVPKILEIVSGYQNSAPSHRIGILLWGLDHDTGRTIRAVKCARSQGCDIAVFRRLIWCPESIQAFRSL